MEGLRGLRIWTHSCKGFLFFWWKKDGWLCFLHIGNNYCIPLASFYFSWLFYVQLSNFRKWLECFFPSIKSDLTFFLSLTVVLGIPILWNWEILIHGSLGLLMKIWRAWFHRSVQFLSAIYTWVFQLAYERSLWIKGHTDAIKPIGPLRSKFTSTESLCLPVAW